MINMSDFQIPGLGTAKPNETLPPLPTEPQPAASNAQEDHDMKDSSNDAPEKQAEAAGQQNNGEASVQAVATSNADSMAVDQPDSPPSLTHALEAAIGGLGGASTAQPQAPPAQPELNEMIDAQREQGAEAEFELDSSPYESSTESSSSDSSDDDSDNEAYELLGVEETARMLMEAEGGSDNEGDGAGKGSGSGQVRTKNELPEEVVPKPDVTITAEMKMEELGSIEHIVENMALVKAITTGEYQVLDSGSVLCTSERVVIGVVAETIGKVLQPMYTVRFTSEDEIKELGLEVGTKVYYPVDHASYVFTEPLKNLKGSDASNLHDEEVGDDEMEFSDDEKEAEYKRSLKQKKKDKWNNKAGGRGGKEPHPLRQEARPEGGLNYDDDDEDGPYKPLARPPGFGSGPVSTETYDPSPRGNFRGRRGDSRGRGGGRGRGGRGGGGRGGYGQPRDGYSLPPQPQQPPSNAWGGNPIPPPPPGQGTPPAMPNFGFQFPGWPQAPAGQAGAPPPPPPPGWPAQQGQANPGTNPAFLNPAFLAALMGQMGNMQQQGGQGQPPPGGQGR